MILFIFLGTGRDGTCHDVLKLINGTYKLYDMRMGFLCHHSRRDREAPKLKGDVRECDVRGCGAMIKICNELSRVKVHVSAQEHPEFGYKSVPSQ